jgi:tetratricopeptide (TPR) repeat protein
MDKIAMLSEILRANPTDAFARYGLAMEYAAQQSFEAALKEFAQLVELNPDYVPGYHMYAQTLLRAGQSDEAKTMLRRGIECAQRMKNAHALGEMAELLGEIDDAP